ncbi:MAG TPA: DUF983 domain-containing protein [Candidatus Polarisedimenticolia bacterium]|nr:DUF983 domain-containing protein [Candidatus Polarisedimenticolia bacterium]
MPSAVNILASAALLRCPRCGTRPVFSGWFRMRRSCRGCELVFEREPGYFIGAIYLNYGFTAALMIGGYFALEVLTPVGPAARLIACAAVGVAVPILFFRHARVLWLGIDIYLDPP